MDILVQILSQVQLFIAVMVGHNVQGIHLDVSVSLLELNIDNVLELSYFTEFMVWFSRPLCVFSTSMVPCNDLPEVCRVLPLVISCSLS